MQSCILIQDCDNVVHFLNIVRFKKVFLFVLNIPLQKDWEQENSVFYKFTGRV